MKASLPDNQTHDYLKDLGLHCEPFSNHSDDRFFYGSSALVQRLDLLAHLTRFGDSVVVVCGPEGSGKSTLMRQFISHSNKQWHVCQIDADQFTLFNPELARITGGTIGADDQSLLQQWSSKTDASNLLVIVVDNAEKLDKIAFSRLSALIKSSHGEQLRLVLFGDTGINQQVKQAQEQLGLIRASQLLEMPRFSEQETASYLMYRLAIAGFSGDQPLTTSEISALNKAADGRPTAINQLANQAFQEHFSRSSTQKVTQKKAPSGKSPVWIRVGAVLTIAGIIAFAGYMGSSQVEAPTKARVTPTLAQEAMVKIPLSLPQPVAKQEAPVTVSQQPAAKISTLNEKAPVTIPAPAPQISTSTITLPAIETGVSQTPPIEKAHIPVPSATPASEPASESTPEPVQPAIDVTDTTITTPPPTTEPPPDTVNAADKISLPHRDKWLQEQPASLYSLQLLGSLQEKPIQDFIKKHQLDLQQVAYYHGDYKGSDWYVLMYGLYPSKQAAIDARSTLPAAVRKGKPWPRSLKSVHEAITPKE